MLRGEYCPAQQLLLYASPIQLFSSVTYPCNLSVNQCNLMTSLPPPSQTTPPLIIPLLVDADAILDVLLNQTTDDDCDLPTHLHPIEGSCTLHHSFPSCTLGPHPTQSVSIAFRNVADKLFRAFSRLKITVRCPGHA
jgi:hypothetical protein